MSLANTRMIMARYRGKTFRVPPCIFHDPENERSRRAHIRVDGVLCKKQVMS